MNLIISVLSLTIYFVIYSVVHSWLAGEPVKNWARRMVGPAMDRWYRLAYNVFAVVSLLPMLVMMALLPDKTLYVAPAPWRWLMVAGQLLAALAAGVTLLQTGALHFVGLAQLVEQNPNEGDALNLDGFYRWVRHPLYTFSLVFLWLMPAMSVNTLTAFVLFTLYFYIGSIYEERRLLARFGQKYEAYRRQAPRLIPVPWRRYKQENVA